MHKLVTLLAGIVLLAGVGFADMDNKDFTIAATNGATTDKSYVMRGTLHGIYINAPSGSTGSVTVATAHETLFTSSITADGMYRPRVSTHTTAGAAATFVGGTNNVANPWYDKAALAGLVTVTVAETGVGTNWVVTLLYDK